jgi:hypothetical protein
MASGSGASLDRSSRTGEVQITRSRPTTCRKHEPLRLLERDFDRLAARHFLLKVAVRAVHLAHQALQVRCVIAARHVPHKLRHRAPAARRVEHQARVVK